MAPQPKTRSAKPKSVSQSGTSSPLLDASILKSEPSLERLNELYLQLENLQVGKMSKDQESAVLEAVTKVSERMEAQPTTPVAAPRPKAPPRLKRKKSVPIDIPSTNSVSKTLRFDDHIVSVEAAKSEYDQYFVKAFEVVKNEEGELVYRKRGILLDMSMFAFEDNEFFTVQCAKTFNQGKITHVQFGKGILKSIDDLSESFTLDADNNGNVAYEFTDFKKRITPKSMRIQFTVGLVSRVLEEEKVPVLSDGSGLNNE